MAAATTQVKDATAKPAVTAALPEAKADTLTVSAQAADKAAEVVAVAVPPATPQAPVLINPEALQTAIKLIPEGQKGFWADVFSPDTYAFERLDNGKYQMKMLTEQRQFVIDPEKGTMSMENYFNYPTQTRDCDPLQDAKLYQRVNQLLQTAPERLEKRQKHANIGLTIFIGPPMKPAIDPTPKPTTRRGRH